MCALSSSGRHNPECRMITRLIATQPMDASFRSIRLR
jgi:hypothetical protein